MGASTLELRVRYKETDRMGRVYHSNYFVWLDMARTEFLRERGCSYKSLEEQGIFFVVAETNCQYLSSLGFDDKVLIKTYLTNLKNVSVQFEYEVFNKDNGEKICKAYTKLGVVDKSGKIVRIPEDVLKRLTPK